MIDMQLKGASYEIMIESGYDEACLLIEASRMQGKAAQIAAERLDGSGEDDHKEGEGGMDQFNEMLEPILLDQSGKKSQAHRATDFDLNEDDWKQFLQCARQRTYKKGEYILKEGQPTAALFQIVRGTVRVELAIKDKAQVRYTAIRTADLAAWPSQLTWSGWLCGGAGGRRRLP